MRVYNLNSAAYSLQNIERKRLKISTLKDLNDPYELKSVQLGNQATRRAMTEFRDKFHQRYGLLCFSRTWHNPVMWSHYGDRHRGICLGFDVPDDTALPVDYVDERTVSEIVDKGFAIETVSFEDARPLLYTKFIDWAYEQEVRIFVPLHEPELSSGLYFAPFTNKIVLREVILGPECKHTVEAVRKMLGPESDVEVIKARLAFESFRVVTDKRSLPDA